MGRCSGGEARVGARRVRKTTCQRRLEKKGPSWYQMLPNVISQSTGISGLVISDNVFNDRRIVVRSRTARTRNVDDDETGLLSTAGHTEVEENVPAHRRGAVERRADGGLRDGRGRGGGVTRTASSSVIKGRLQVQLGGRPRTYCLISCTPGPSRASQEPQCHLAWSRVPIPSGHPAVLLALPTTTGLLRGHRLDRTGANTPPQPLEPAFK